MQTFKTENQQSPINEDTIEKLVGVMMDIVNKKQRPEVIKERRCSNYFFNKAKRILVDMSSHNRKKVDKVTKIHAT